jgi:hypothetical protein
VSVTKDLTITGKWDEKHGRPLTVIKGGWAPLAIGRLYPEIKPETIDVNGHAIPHIGYYLFDQFYFPFLHPPYYNPETDTYSPYDLSTTWKAVDVTIRQITFDRPFHMAIRPGGMRGGSIERCRFLTTWPINEFHAFAMHFWSMQFSLAWMSPIPVEINSYDLISGDIVVRDNVFESDHREAYQGDTDESGHLVFLPYEGNPTPPDGDYDGYVLQDLSSVTDTATITELYWVRKGWEVVWVWLPDGQQQVMAFRGHFFVIGAAGTQADLTVKNNTFRDFWGAGINLGPNGQLGVPTNLNVTGNRFISDLQTVYPGGEAVLAADWYGGSPGTNAVVKDNNINLAYTGPGDTRGTWNNSAIDLEIMGKAVVAGNTIKMNSEGAISFWEPTQNGVAVDNRILGEGDYAFASFSSNGNQYLSNNVRGFSPSGPGVFDLGWGWPPAPIPAARGILADSNSNLVQGLGKPGPLDTVFDCGTGNTIKNMTVLPCPYTPAPIPEGEPALSAGSVRAPLDPSVDLFMGKWAHLPQK